MSKITFEDKVDIRNSELPRKNTVTGADLNEIKKAVNNIALLTHEVTLTKAQLNTINDDGGITIPLSDLGCKAGEGINIFENPSITEVSPDGTPFDSSNNVLDLTQDAAVAGSISALIVQSAGNLKYGNSIDLARMIIRTNDLVFTCKANITGGGPNAYIKIKFYYQIVTV